MKNLFYFFSLVFLASCSTAYKSGQTPDDLYYAKPKLELAKETNKERNTGKYEEDYADQQIRMGIRNQRWRTLGNSCDCDCNYNPYNYGYNYGYYYNPYFYPYPVYNNNYNVKFVNPKNTTIRSTNLGGYSNTVTTMTQTKIGGAAKAITIRGYNNTNNTKNSTYNESGTYSQPRSDTRTYTPSSSSSSSSNTNTSTPSRGTSITMPGR